METTPAAVVSETQTVQKEEFNRNLRVLKPSDKPTKPPPDEENEVTTSDLKREYASQQQKKEEASVLSTKEWKDRNKKITKYEKTYIRFRFPDRIEVEAVFKPEETIEDAINFLKADVLQHPSTPLYLFVTPPVQKLAKEKNLQVLGLVPSAIIHFAYEKGIELKEYLRPELASQAVEKNPQTVTEEKKETKQEGPSTTEKPAAKKVPLPKWLQTKKK